MSVMTQKLTTSHVKVECEEFQDGIKTIGDCLKFYADTLGDAEAIVFASCDTEGRVAITWNDVYYKSCIVARSLIKLGNIICS